MTLKREHIINRIMERTGLDKNLSRRAFETTLEIMKENLRNGNNLVISGFGKFQIRQKKSRRGRNPQTGEEMKISGRKVLTFKVSKVLKRKINGELI
ncbi:MAG: integration host factor subunit alpha [Deltaproteobacteria bacterium]|nr:integration host factor subunit alpha [Deltaproteobacteria bacterium]MBW2308749.1 integration host factor subunit alpha [Deltaproteobacteria bacterium]